LKSLRLLLAFALCMAIMLGWAVLNPPPPRPQAPPAPQPAAPAAPEAAAPPQAPAAPAVPAREQVEVPLESRTLVTPGPGKGTTPLVKAEASNREGGIDDVELPEFRSRDEKGPLVLIPRVEGSPETLALWAAAPQAQFRRDRDSDLKGWTVGGWPGTAGGAFSREVEGLVVTKSLQTVPGQYHLKFTLTFENRSDQERKVHYRLRGPAGLNSEALQGEGSDLNLIDGERGPDGQTAIRVNEVSSIKVPDWEGSEDRVVLVGVSNNYYAAVLAAADTQTSSQLKSAFAEIVPDPAQERKLAKSQFGRDWQDLDRDQRVEIEKKTYKNVRTGLRSRDLSVPAGGKATHSFILFLGPRDQKVLAAYPELNLVDLNNYGWWGPLVKLFLQILKGLHYLLFGSWGLAIMGLTLVVRFCLHPLNRRQQASMMRYQKKMNAVKPQLDAIRERFAQNRLKMNQEMQKLMKEHGINPGQMMFGCLMIFLQLPIWLALYNSIRYSLDLRQAPFLWISDLTQPDRLLALPFTVPFAGWTYLNVLPIVYVILTILQQKMQPKPTDPQMQQQMKMMTFMMVFFGFIFYSYPAGFLLYFITSAAIGMIESKVIKRVLAREGLGPQSVAAAAGSAGLQPPLGGAPALYPARRPGEPKRKKR
jgi:YidC/Oxa1 family membrane protein insertase